MILLAMQLAILVASCVPTLSAPRGEAHLSALRDARRHFHHGRFDEAAASFALAASAAERRVDRDEALYAQARSLLRLDRRREALAILDEVAARRPVSRRTARALFDSALVRLELGEAERADSDLERVVRHYPDDGPASRALWYLLRARENQSPQERLRFLSRLYDEVGQHDVGDDLLDAEADLFLEIGDRAGAVAALERLVREHAYPHGQRWDDALVRLADLAQEDGDHERAIALLTRLLEPHQRELPPGTTTLPTMPAARLRIARIYRDRLHDPVRAAHHFEGVTTQFPESLLRDDALFELGEMWLDGGRRVEGCAMLARVVREFEVGHARRLARERHERDCRE
ncbi:MAG: tetratricopeptide repeat protein [Sandaracinaceae bacterium]|nr:tetratricopeptide repeat protein [Sandaracinaceae bacterium]